MLFRFCLYGFLKNQKYYDPFLVLAFLEKGLSFFMIGILLGFREVCINLFEVPSGALADLYGRRRAMIFSFSAYLVSFGLFALSASLAGLFAAMFFFALGEAFRSGTHKAMIFDWLSVQGRAHEKAKIYGLTRSWSQLGSALSVLIAAAIVIFEGRYSRVFLYSMVPYAFGLVNFLGYPSYLDGETRNELSLRRVFDHLLDTLRQCIGHRPLRRLLGESMLQRGTWQTVQHYLQPVLQQTALALPLALALDERGRSAVLVGAVYFLLYLLSALATRHAHRVRDLFAGGAAFTGGIFLLTVVVYLLLVPALIVGWQVVAIAAFVLLAVLQNLWKPIFLERVDETSDGALGATVLSVDGQTKALFVALAAPALGWSVDTFGLSAVGALGMVTSIGVLTLLRTDEVETVAP